METESNKAEALENPVNKENPECPAVVEEITVEEMAVDGICGIY